MKRCIHGTSLITAAVFIAAVTAQPGFAQTTHRYSIAAQDLAGALRIFSAESGKQVIFADDVVAGKRGQAVDGEFEPDPALDAILARSGLHATVIDGAYVIRPNASAETTRLTDENALVVTGTRIRGSAPTGSPIVVVTRDAIDKSGRASVADILQTIPQNFGGGQNEATQGNSVRNGASDNTSFGSGINLRGLGDSSTLVLFDGIRPALAGANGSFSDVSLIPSTAIERIELLTDGASAIYGSDAVAGVVNFRFRNRFEGFETRLRSETADGDFSNFQVSQLAGKRWSNGGVMLALEYSHRDRLPSSDRAFATNDLRRFGGPDNRSVFATPGTITAADGQIFGIPAGQNGTNLTEAQLILGQQNRSDQQRLFDILPAQSTVSAYGAIDQALGGGVALFARGLYAHRVFDVRAYEYGQDYVTVPVTNAFYVDPIGTHQPVQVAYDLQRDFGTEGDHGSVDAITGVAGVTAHHAGWNLELSATYGSVITHNNNRNIVNVARLATALADSNPATAFNVFGDGSANNPATIAAIRGGADARTRALTFGQALRIDGALLTLPAGVVKLAVGVERRDEQLNYDLTVDRSDTLFSGTLAGLPGHRVVSAAYGELLIPLMSNAVASWFPGQIDVSLAGRIERYTDVGVTRDPKLGVSWRFVEGLTARASYGTSFRAPYFRDLAGPSGNLYLTFVLPDPRSPTGQTNAIGLFGLPDHLSPERAKTLTFGVDVQPRIVPGLTASATYFRVDYRDRIGTASVNLFDYLNQRDVYGSLVQDSPSAATVAGYYASPLFQNIANVPAASIGAIINGYTLNLSRVVIRGLDFNLNYVRDLVGGKAAIGIAATRMLNVDQRITPTATPIDTVGMFGSPVKLRGRINADWSGPVLSFGGAVNYTGGYTNQTATPIEHVHSYVTIDAQIGVTIPSATPGPKVRFALSAVNLLDRGPPYVQNVGITSTLAYDPDQASLVGRTLSLQAIVAW